MFTEEQRKVVEYVLQEDFIFTQQQVEILGQIEGNLLSIDLLNKA